MTTQGAKQGRPAHSALVWLWLSAVVIVLDQLSKYVVVTHMKLAETIAVLPWLNWHLAYNTGAAFSFLGRAGGSQVIFLAVVSLVVVVVMVGWMRLTPRHHYALSIGLALVVGGAIGNVIDRIRLSYVIDFVDFHVGSWHFATFNLADSAITLGAICLVVHFVFEQRTSS